MTSPQDPAAPAAVPPEAPPPSPPDVYRPLGLAALLREAAAGTDLTPFGEQLIAWAQSHDDPAALLELALVLELKYQRDSALAVQQLALQGSRHYVLPTGASPGAPRLLVLKAPGDLMANTPFECLLDGADLHVEVLYVDDALPLPDVLPAHDVLLIAACASDANVARLARMAGLATASRRPVLNRPERIGVTTRDAAYALLGHAPGIRMADTRRVSRARLLEAAAGRIELTDGLDGDWPLIVRPVGAHAGQGLARIGAAHELAAYLEVSTGDEFYLAPFVEYRSDDGLYRKYRIVLIDGVPHACHMGLSTHWIVHYPYAEMAGHPDRRDEEARCFAHFDTDFAVRHRDAFAAVVALTGLDYIGFDCAETRDGKLLIFEVATAMVVHDIDDPTLYPYKQPQMRRVFAAFRALLQQRAAEPDAPLSSPDA